MKYRAINKTTKEEYTDFRLTIWPDGSGNIFLPETQEEIDLSEVDLISVDYSKCYFCKNKVHIKNFGGVFSPHGTPEIFCKNIVCLIALNDWQKKQKDKEEWEEEGQKLMDKLNMFDLEILNTIVYHRRQEAILETAEDIRQLLYNGATRDEVHRRIDEYVSEKKGGEENG